MNYLGEYTEVGWQNEPSRATPINAHNLGVMEDGIKRLFYYLLAGGGTGGGSATDGREVELRNNGEYIQWRYSGDEEWINLVSLSDLKGEKGDDYVLTEEDILKIAEKVKIDVPDSAADISFKNEGTNIESTDVQGAISELSGQIRDLEENGVIGSRIEPREDDIPKVFIDGIIPTTKDEVLAELTYVSKTDNFHAYLEIKCQGDSSMGYPKKNFTIKMFSDEARETKLKKEFRGWGEHNKYVLKANYIDHTHARNIVSAELWGEVVASRSDYDSLPQELRESPNNGAIEGFPIKVYNNGTYQGIYTGNMPKDDWLYGVDEDNPNQFVLYGQKNTDGVYAETANNFRKLWDGVSQSDREWEVEVGTNSDIVKTALNNVISLCMNADDETFKNTLNNYLDVQSALDYYIFVYTICALDSLAQNMILVSYDGTKLYCSAYDLDSTFGLWWNGQSFVSTSYRCPEDYQERYSLLWERIEKLYAEELKERYSKLRKSVLSFSNMVTEFERFMDVIGLDLYEEDLKVYSDIPSGNTNNITQVRNYIRDRLVYCDSEFEKLGEETDEPDIPEVTLSSISATYTGGSVLAGTSVSNLTGIVVTAIYSDGTTKTVTDYILSGTIAEGNNTVNVSYGGKSTTFTVVGYVEEEPEVTLTSISATYTGGDVTVGTSVNDLTGITVTAHYSDGSTANVTSFSLSGTIEVGSNTITVSYNGKTATFTVVGVPSDANVVNAELTSNKYINSSNGNYMDNTVGKATESYIPIHSMYNRMEVDKTSDAMSICLAFYDADKNYLYGYDSAINKFIFKGGESFVRISVFNTDLTTVTLRFSEVELNKAEVSWSENATSKIGADGIVSTTGGNAYLIENVQVPSGTNAIVLRNVGDSSYRWKEVALYDADNTFIAKYYEGGLTGGTATGTYATTIDITDLNVAYLSATAFPNNVATNNNPNSQLELLFGSIQTE